MDPSAGFLLYAASYRLAIVVAGVVAITLGYRLFLHGMTAGQGGGTDASAETGGFKLSIRNAAPGTCFALFGAVVIAAMIVQGNPEMAAGPAEAGLRMKGPSEATATAAGPPASADAAAALAVWTRMLSAPDVTVPQVARASSGIARVYLQQGREKEALALARLAVQLAPAEADHLATLAIAARANGEHAEATAAAQRAAGTPAAGSAR